MSAWPWPGDSPLERAQRVARSYREHLARLAPDVVDLLDARFTELGEPWVAPRQVTVDPDDWVTIDLAAEQTGISVAALYKWAARDQRVARHTGHDRRLRVRFGDVLDAQAEIRQERAARRS